ncbi:MAG: SHOCT domain-containing protein [Actinomycetota bacterium]
MSEQRDYERRKQHLLRRHEARRAAETDVADRAATAPPPDTMARAATTDTPEQAEVREQPQDRGEGGDRPEASDATATRYRGRPVGRSRPLSAPGAHGLGTGTPPPQFRGARSDMSAVSAPAVGNDHGEAVMDALRRLGAMHAEGLITTDDYERKRTELLDRL